MPIVNLSDAEKYLVSSHKLPASPAKQFDCLIANPTTPCHNTPRGIVVRPDAHKRGAPSPQYLLQLQRFMNDEVRLNAGDSAMPP